MSQTAIPKDGIIEFPNAHKGAWLIVSSKDGRIALRLVEASGHPIFEAEIDPTQLCVDIENSHPIAYTKKRKARR